MPAVILESPNMPSSDAGQIVVEGVQAVLGSSASSARCSELAILVEKQLTDEARHNPDAVAGAALNLIAGQAAAKTVTRDQDRDEIASRVFARLWLRYQEGLRWTNGDAYARTIASNLVADLNRSESTRQRHLERLRHATASQANDGVDEVVAAHLTNVLGELLGELSEGERDVLRQLFVKDKTLASVSGRNPRTRKRLERSLHRTLNKLRGQIEARAAIDPLVRIYLLGLGFTQ